MQAPRPHRQIALTRDAGRYWLAVAGARPWGVLDHADELVASVAVRAGEFDEIVDRAQDCTALRCTGDRDAAAAAELEQAFVAQGTKCAKHGVGVDAEHCCHVFGEWEALAWAGFAVGDRAAYLSRDLEVERRRFRRVYLARENGVY
jgi:hypothetical protein